MTATLTGPAPDLQRDRWGRPLVVPPQPLGAPPEPYTRATTVAKTLDDSSGLMLWKQRMTLLGLVGRRDLLTAAAATDPSDTKTLNRIAEDAADAGGSTAAATVGTALHAFTERLDRGLPLGHVPAEHQADLDAYQRLAEKVGWTVQHVEQFTVLDAWKVAGTADRVLEIDGRWYIADLKTGQSTNYPHAWAVQFAIYAHGLPYDIATRTRVPWAQRIDTDRALVIHLPATKGTASAHWVDIHDGWQAFHLCVAARKWNARRDLLTGYTPPADLEADDLTARIRAARSVEDLNLLWATHQDAWTDAHTAAAATRKAALTTR